jgi:hypothetical protein
MGNLLGCITDVVQSRDQRRLRAALKESRAV